MDKIKRLDIIVAILWSLCLVADIVSYAKGNTPNWVLVFCPLACLVLESWLDIFKK